MQLNKTDIKMGLASELAKQGMTLDDLEASLTPGHEKQADVMMGLLSLLGILAKKGLAAGVYGAAGMGGALGMAGYGGYRALKDSDEKAKKLTDRGATMDRALAELKSSKEQEQYKQF